jgi:flagellar motor switch protein FliM
LRGVCVLEMNARLGLAIIDRLMGGPGHAATLQRDFSDMELALLDGSAQVIIAEWCKHWGRYETLHGVLLGHETNARFVQAAQPHSMMFVLGLEARVGDCMEQIQLAFPCSTLEPLVRKFREKLHPDRPEAARNPTPKWRADLEKVRIRVTAECAPVQLKARAVAGLKVGDLLPLDPDFFSRIQLRLAGAPKFAGRLGTKGTRWGVEITNVLKS